MMWKPSFHRHCIYRWWGQQSTTASCTIQSPNQRHIHQQRPGANKAKSSAGFRSSPTPVPRWQCFGDHLAPLPYDPTPEQRQQIDEFINYLLAENQKYNLTGAKTIEEVRSRHVDDCLSFLPVLNQAVAAASQTLRSNAMSAGRISSPAPRQLARAADVGVMLESAGQSQAFRVLDVGSGAGLPGLVIAICHPDWQVVMLDSSNKRCAFVKAVAQQLELKNTSVVWARAEDAGHDHHLREHFHVVTARAVAQMPLLAELTLPFVRVGGCLAVAKGADPQAEVETAKHAVRMLGGGDMVISPVASHGPKGQRTAVLVVKEAATPAQYPRAFNQMKKWPL